MKQEKLWLFFLGILIFLALGYTSNTIYKIYHYLILDKQVPLQTLVLTIKEKEVDDLIIQADYQFNYKNHEYSGLFSFDEHFLNRHASEDAKKELQKNMTKVWIDSDNPNHFSLQKKFPFKQSISTVILWSLIFYFFLLRRFALSHK